MQSETLDTLKEGVAVFGSDGRLKLFNPAFAGLWALRPSNSTTSRISIAWRSFARRCSPTTSDWDELRAVVAGLPDHRLGFESRLARRDGTVLDCAAAPLPDGATLLTFIDATAGVNVERALTERNQALIDAEKLRNDFVHHVSYELRSPLTNIIGFIQLLGDAAVGPLNEQQLEYAGYVTKSSSALLAIINDILDLASIDADAMELSLDEVDIAETMRAAAEGVQDRLAESNLSLRDRRHGRHRRLRRRRQAHPANSVQSSFQRDRLLRARPDDRLSPRCGAATRSCSRSATRGAAFRPTSSTMFSIASKRIRQARAIAASASASRSSGPSSNCMAAAS